MESLYLAQYDDFYIVDLNKVLYFMADDHYTHTVYSSGQNILVPFGLQKIEELVIAQKCDDNPFLRLGRKYIVNINRVFRISVTKQELALTDDLGQNIVLHISKPVLRALHELLSSRNSLSNTQKLTAN